VSLQRLLARFRVPRSATHLKVTAADGFFEVVSLADVAADGPSPEAIAAEHSRAAQLMEFLSSTLDETERRVFILHYGDDMPLASVTRVLRLDNPSGAKAYIVSARRKLARAVRRLRARGEAL